MSDSAAAKDDQGDFGEAGGESMVSELKARDPSFFATPWDPPELDTTRDDRPSVLAVASNEQLTQLQSDFIRTDATVRPNRVWKGRYDRYNGQHFIDALKEALVYPQPQVEPKRRRLLMVAMAHGEEIGGEAHGEGEEGEEESDTDGEDTSRDPIKLILDVLKFVQEKHNKLWKFQAFDNLCKEYRRKVQEINEAKRRWKMKVVQLQMDWADMLTKELIFKQKQMLKIKEKIEDFELMKELVKYERKVMFKQAQKAMKERRKIKIVEERKRRQERKQQRRREKEAKKNLSLSPQMRLEAMKRSLLYVLRSMSMVLEFFDNDKLIAVVQLYPALWDKGHPDYADKQKKDNAWRAVMGVVWDEEEVESWDISKKNLQGKSQKPKEDVKDLPDVVLKGHPNEEGDDHEWEDELCYGEGEETGDFEPRDEEFGGGQNNDDRQGLKEFESQENENERAPVTKDEQALTEDDEMDVEAKKMKIPMDEGNTLETGVILKMFGFKSKLQDLESSPTSEEINDAQGERHKKGMKRRIEKASENMRIWMGKMRDAVTIKTTVDDYGNEVKEIPLYLAVPDDYPSKSVIQSNLERAIELSEEMPDTNPYELALCKTMGQEIFHQSQNRYRRSTFRGVTSSTNNKLTPRTSSGSTLVSKFDWVREIHEAISTLNSIELGPSRKMGLFEKLRSLEYMLKSNPKFARVGVLRHYGGHTKFVPELKNFDRRTRSILVTKNKERIEKLPLSAFNVSDTVSKLFTNLSKPTQSDLHITFRGTMNKLEGKSIIRIFIEDTLTPEEMRRRYKGRKWMERKLSEFYDEFTKKKNEITGKGIEGRIHSEKHNEQLEGTCCPIFWDLANYLRSILENIHDDDPPVTAADIPTTIKDLRRLFHTKILELRPELSNRSKDLEKLLCKWGGSDNFRIDLVSIANLMWILAEIEEFKPCWLDIKETLIESTTCPLCLLFRFLNGTTTRQDYLPSKTQEKYTDRWSLRAEVMNLEEIAAEFKEREKQPVDPSRFPDKDLFHIITTVDESMNPRAFQLGQDKDSTRLFVMRSCGTVIFDLSRSEKELPWAWSYLKQHMELLDKKDVRDEADVEPMRHLILITNFLSWANSPQPVKMRISEKTFHQRVPHPDYVGNFKLENAVHYVGVNYRHFKLRTTIIYTGIPFGEEEDVLVYLFKMAWDNELELPLFGPGRNILPLINITDLKWIVVKTVNERTYPLMIFALNKNDQTLFAIASRIAKTLGSSKVVKFPSPDFHMKFCIPKIIDDLLKQNIRYDNIEIPHQVRPLWNHAFLKQKKLQEVIKELRKTRKLYGKTVFLIGPPSKAKSELAIIISKLYNLPLIHKENILNYFLRATQEAQPSKAEGEEEEEEGQAEEEEEERERDGEDDDDKTKPKRAIDPNAEEKRFHKLMKKMVDGKAANKERKHLTRLLQRLLQSVFIQAHGYVLVDWPIRKEDAIALFTKVMEDPQIEEELEEPKPIRPPPARPEYVIHVAAEESYLDETNYFLFQDLQLKTFDEMENDFREFLYYRQTHQSVVDLFEERNTPIYRLTCHDGFKVVGKLIAILGEPEQASGRWIYDMFLRTELACNDEAIEKGEQKMREAKWLKKRYKQAVNELLTVQRERNFSLREQLLGNPLELFKISERFPSNTRSSVYPDYKEWRDMAGMTKLKNQWTEPSRVWKQVANRKWIATFEKAKEYWLK